MNKIFLVVIIILIGGLIIFQGNLPSSGKNSSSKMTGDYKLTFDKELLHSNLYSPTNLRSSTVASSSTTITWDFANKNLLVPEGMAPEYAILSGFRIYRDGFWLTDVSKTHLAFTDERLSPNETYTYQISAITFDNKIEGTKSAELIVKTPTGKASTIVFPKKEITTYLAEGDSIAEGKTGVNGVGWVDQVSKYLKTQNPKVKVYNKAVTNSVASTVSDRLPQEVSEIHPDLITVGIGVNDVQGASRDIGNISMSEYREHLLELIQTAKKEKASLVLLNITYITCCDAKIVAWNKLIRDTAHAEGILLVDVTTAMQEKGKNSLMLDMLHPNVSGHTVIAKEVIAALKTQLK